MASVLKEYRLFDEDSCTIVEEGDVINLETYETSYKDVCVKEIWEHWITIEIEDYEEIDIRIDDILDFELL